MTDERELGEPVEGANTGAEEESVNPVATPESEPGQTQTEVVIPDDYNWDNHPGFRDWKRRMEQKQQEVEQRYRQQLTQQHEALREQQLEGMDDYERLKFELDEERQAKDFAYQRLQEMEIEAAKRAALQEVSSVMGVPVEQIADAQDVNDAWRKAAMYKQQSEQQRAAEAAEAAAAKAAAREEKRQRNTVDTGTGTPIPTSDYEREYQKHRAAKDPWSMFTHALSNSRE